jgi:hypothetical protein
MQSYYHKIINLPGSDGVHKVFVVSIRLQETQPTRPMELVEAGKTVGHPLVE